MTLASLWRRASSANSGQTQFTARTPATLSAATAMPIPVPQYQNAAVGLAGRHGAGDLLGVVGIVDPLAGLGPHVDDLVAEALQEGDKLGLLIEAGMV